MALGDALLKQLSKKADQISDEKPTAGLKSKAALIISVFAAIYSIDAFIGSQIGSKILNNTIHVSDVWNFYQSKSIKQTLAEMQLDDAIDRKDEKKIIELKGKIARYESDPATGEGKKELLAQAKGIEAEITHLKKQSPWIGLAGSIMQIAIVLLTASILSPGMLMFWTGLGTMAVATGLMLQGIFLWF
jgi:Domain of unknown function (DUF4337)